MDDGCKTVQDFLKKNQHDIYHLFKFNQRCCQCSHDYEFPVTKELLQEDQYIRKCSICHSVQTEHFLIKVERYAQFSDERVCTSSNASRVSSSFPQILANTIKF
jgi:hypothetical protein